MIRGVEPSAERFLLALAQLDQRIERAQREISSGHRLETASDDPDQVARLLQLRAELAQNGQARANLAVFKLETDVAARTLEQADALVERAKSLSALGITGTLSAEMRATLIQQVEGLQQEMVGLAGTQVNGRYLFSGDRDQAAPYTLDFGQPRGVSSYAGSASTRQAPHPDGSAFLVSRTAQEIFDDAAPGQSVFGALNALRLGLVNNDPIATQDALQLVQAAEEHLHNQALFYGAVQRRISDATDYADSRTAQLQTALGSIEDADVTARIVELKELEFDREAALSARAREPRTSLFDYLG